MHELVGGKEEKRTTSHAEDEVSFSFCSVRLVFIHRIQPYSQAEKNGAASMHNKAVAQCIETMLMMLLVGF